MTSLHQRLSFVFVPAEDASVDPVFEVYLDGEKTSYSIQQTFGTYSVTREGWDIPGDDSTYFVQFFEEEYRVLGRAKDHVLKLIEADLASAPSAPAAGM